ncbi:MAG: tetratricopeptide repeat protein [Oscillospiraceae bacterium]|nr:tetratricopeptide repeat protein [Oscillospiraceae bacterium]
MQKNDSKTRTISNWKVVFISLLCLFSIIISALSLIFAQQQTAKNNAFREEIKSYLSDEESIDLKTNAYLEFCESINNKADSVFNELLTIVGIFASIITLLGVLITFKAPKDIELEIDKLHNLLTETQFISEEQKYLLEISSAIKEKTIYHRIRALDEVINKFPNKCQAYIHRGNEYDDKKEYNKAISDYKSANKLGCDKETYYNNMSISLSKRAKATGNRMDQEQALVYISKAINLCPEDAIYYTNRGTIYEEMNQFEKALIDYDKALSLDPENYEAYTNKAILYMDLTHSTEDDILSSEYREKAINCIRKALELNSEDNYNLNRLNKLLKEKLESEKDDVIEDDDQEVINNLLFSINEKMGDIDCEREDYVAAISNYTDALISYNITSEKTIIENLPLIDRICNKIFDCKSKMPSIDISDSINRKLLLLIIMLNDIAFNYYKNQQFANAGKMFEYTTILSGYGTSASNNLAYMIRRSEYICNRFKLQDLLSCRTPDETSSFLRINRALCRIKGIEYNRSIEEALREINVCENELESALTWWSDAESVGTDESNLVLLLLSIMDKIELDDNYDIQEMIRTAISDGYDLPNDILEIAETIRNE